jgi:hypothetical protein
VIAGNQVPCVGNQVLCLRTCNINIVPLRPIDKRRTHRDRSIDRTHRDLQAMQVYLLVWIVSFTAFHVPGWEATALNPAISLKGVFGL